MPKFQFAINSAVDEVTGLTPSFTAFGSEILILACSRIISMRLILAVQRITTYVDVPNYLRWGSWCKRGSLCCICVEEHVKCLVAQKFSETRYRLADMRRRDVVLWHMSVLKRHHGSRIPVGSTLNCCGNKIRSSCHASFLTRGVWSGVNHWMP